jgi:anti-sigma28 factor (negative regulator of flagellin synthesis)
MVNIVSLTGVPEPNSNKPVQNKERTAPAPEEASSTSSDAILISPEASQAAENIDKVKAQGSEIRQERIEAAKENIEQGTYKVQEVVVQVAARLSQYVQ